MDNARKNAYRYLLYNFLIEIRTAPIPEQPKFSLEQLTKRSYYAGAMAYAFHNLALASASDFEEFCETSFWAGLARLSATNPTLEISHYQNIFDDQIRLSSN